MPKAPWVWLVYGEGRRPGLTHTRAHPPPCSHMHWVRSLPSGQASRPACAGLAIANRAIRMGVFWPVSSPSSDDPPCPSSNDLRWARTHRQVKVFTWRLSILCGELNLLIEGTTNGALSITGRQESRTCLIMISHQRCVQTQSQIRIPSLISSRESYGSFYAMFSCIRFIPSIICKIV